MCKLFAYVNQEDKTINYTVGNKINKVLQHLFYINSFGQTDGSGLMWTTSRGETMFIKDAVPSPTLMQFTVFNEHKKDFYKHKWVAGHNRYSTVGSNTWENSHPFLHGKYLGMQNGTIYNNHKTLVEGKQSPCSVDSSSVFWAFNQQGVEKTFENYEGAGVFMYINTEEKTFNIVKNDERNLHIVKISGISAFLITTDKYALELVCNRAGLPIEDVKEVKNDTLLTFHSNKKTSTKPLKVKPATVSIYDSTYWSYWDKAYSKRYNKVKHKAKTSSTKSTSDLSKIRKTTASTKKTPAISNKQTSLYLTDCYYCSNPLMTSDLIFADNSDYNKARVFCCSGCVMELGDLLNRKLYKVEVKGEQV